MRFRSILAVVCVAWFGPALCGCHNMWVRPLLLDGGRELASEHFLIRTDVSPTAGDVLIEACEEALVDFDRLLGPPSSARKDAPAREVVVFASLERFRRFLRGHWFTSEQAVGFYCELGRECALRWNDPPSPEDLRILRHELAHQELARRFGARLPTWLEEGVAEYMALASANTDPQWRAYVRHRAGADAVAAAMMLNNGQRSWSPQEDSDVRALPQPLWAKNAGGYILHVAFARFIASHDTTPLGNLFGQLAQAEDGELAELDLSLDYGSLAELESAFGAYSVDVGLHVLLNDASAHHLGLRNVAIQSLAGYGTTSTSAHNGR